MRLLLILVFLRMYVVVMAEQDDKDICALCYYQLSFFYNTTYKDIDDHLVNIKTLCDADTLAICVAASNTTCLIGTCAECSYPRLYGRCDVQELACCAVLTGQPYYKMIEHHPEVRKHYKDHHNHGYDDFEGADLADDPIIEYTSDDTKMVDDDVGPVDT